MKIAVVQHRLRDTPAQDAEALYQAAVSASDAGAEFVVFPDVASLREPDNQDRAMLFLRLGSVPGQRLIPQLGPENSLFAGIGEAPEGLDGLGSMALLVGDAAMDPEDLGCLAKERPALAVLIPRSENDLQAEAVLEVAIALSDSLAGLVLVAETDGAEPGDPGHGGSAIILLGDVIAEAQAGDDVLLADIDIPIAQPEPREPLPEMPTILQQRLANHRGTHLEVSYLADLSDGAGPR